MQKGSGLETDEMRVKPMKEFLNSKDVCSQNGNATRQSLQINVKYGEQKFHQ